MKKEEENRPCPFCGEPDRIWLRLSDGLRPCQLLAHFVCGRCSAAGPVCELVSLDKIEPLIVAWNARCAKDGGASE